jgi:hypothetical protein
MPHNKKKQQGGGPMTKHELKVKRAFDRGAKRLEKKYGWGWRKMLIKLDKQKQKDKQQLRKEIANKQRKLKRLMEKPK